MRYLGIDYGEKRIGLALGDSETKIATPYRVVNCIDGIKKAVKEELVDEIVIGVPVRLDGSNHGTMKEKLDVFIGAVGRSTGKKIHLVNEVLSSKAADSLVRGVFVKTERDAVAAMVILQDFFNIIEANYERNV